MGLLGAHVSVSGGLHKALIRGMDLGCQAIQVFTRNQMRWSASPLKEEEILQYRDIWENQAQRMPVLSHASYLLNLGSPEPDKLAQSRQAFLQELDRCELLGIHGIVFHPGAHLNQISIEDCVKTVADSINDAIQARPDYQVKILIENTAGQGSTIGHQFEQVAGMLQRIDAPGRVGVCIDTCHTLAAGYPLTTPDEYEALIQTLDSIIGLQWIQAFHVNDSKKDCGSRVDRHQHIGEGFIGLEAFRCLVNDTRFTNIPMVLETPGEDADYARNLNCLKGLRQSAEAST